MLRNGPVRKTRNRQVAIAARRSATAGKPARAKPIETAGCAGDQRRNVREKPPWMTGKPRHRRRAAPPATATKTKSPRDSCVTWSEQPCLDVIADTPGERVSAMPQRTAMPRGKPQTLPPRSGCVLGPLSPGSRSRVNTNSREFLAVRDIPVLDLPAQTPGAFPSPTPFPSLPNGLRQVRAPFPQSSAAIAARE